MIYQAILALSFPMILEICGEPFFLPAIGGLATLLYFLTVILKSVVHSTLKVMHLCFIIYPDLQSKVPFLQTFLKIEYHLS